MWGLIAMDIEEAKTAILKRLCYDYKRWGRGFGIAAPAIQLELKIPGEVFGEALSDLIVKHIFVERVPGEATHIRLSEAGTLQCK